MKFGVFIHRHPILATSILLFLLITTLKFLYCRICFRKNNNWFDKFLQLDISGIREENQTTLLLFFSDLQVLIILIFLMGIVNNVFHPQTQVFLCLIFGGIFLILSEFARWEKNNQRYAFLFNFVLDTFFLDTTILLDNIFEKRKGPDISSRDTINLVSRWPGSYWIGNTVNEKMITSRQIKFVLPRKYRPTKKNLRMLQKILDYSTKMNVKSNIISPVFYKKKFLRKMEENSWASFFEGIPYEEIEQQVFETLKKVNLVTIIYWQDRFYMSGKKRLENGFFIDCDPVQKIEKDAGILATVLNDRRNCEIPVMSVEEGQILLPETEQIILRATGAKSWGHLAFKGLAYTVVWTKEKTYLYFSKLDRYGRWEYDRERTQEFFVTESLEGVADIIIEDVNKPQKPKLRFWKLRFLRSRLAKKN